MKMKPPATEKKIGPLWFR